jgi:serine/threonine protein kinase
MEYVPGGTLSARLKDGRIDWDPLTLAGDLLDALAHIHAAGILHRDLKPANVLFGTDGRARLTDFGIAHLADGTKLTSTGFVVGTENYLAPEVRRGGAATVESDLYGLGVVLRECTPTPAPAALTELVERLTDPDPGRRPKSAAAARAFLDGTPAQATAAMPVDADAPTQVAPAPTPVYVPPRRRLPARALAAVLAVLVVAVVLVLVLANRGGSGEPLQTPPAGGSVAKQLDQLDDAIDHAHR